MPPTIDFPAAQTGRFARKALAPGSTGTVIAAFARSFYVETPAGLACIGTQALGGGPLNLLLSAQVPTVQVGDTLACDGDGVAFEAGIRISLHTGRPWLPPAMPIRSWHRLPESIARCRRQCATRVPAEGFGFLIAGPRKPAALAAARQSVRAYAAWLAQLLGGRRAAAPPEAAALIGLGPGLTPSGDDLIGGSMVALHACGRSAVAGRIARWSLDAARDRTGRISRAHLACAAEGEGGEALHGLLSALAGGASAFHDEIESIDAVGHTSGWDAAAGALLALRLLGAGAGNPNGAAA